MLYNRCYCISTGIPLWWMGRSTEQKGEVFCYEEGSLRLLNREETGNELSCQLYHNNTRRSRRVVERSITKRASHCKLSCVRFSTARRD